MKQQNVRGTHLGTRATERERGIDGRTHAARVGAKGGKKRKQVEKNSKTRQIMGDSERGERSVRGGSPQAEEEAAHPSDIATWVCPCAHAREQGAGPPTLKICFHHVGDKTAEGEEKAVVYAAPCAHGASYCTPVPGWFTEKISLASSASTS